MNLAQAIIGFYPNIKPLEDFVVQDDGEGAYIKEWNYDKPIPTDKQLEEGWKKITEEGQRKEKVGIMLQVYSENPQDISRKERIEFIEYFTFANNNIFYPLEEYPLILEQAMQWVQQGKLPSDFLS